MTTKYSKYDNISPNLGLFANAIVMGGNALCDIFFQTNPQEAAVELASRLDCTSEKGEDILRCLSTQTQQAIVTKTSEMNVSVINFVAFLCNTYTNEYLYLLIYENNEYFICSLFVF